ncbi:c-type cytochrome [Thiocystis minor]|uniref:c-type cytochrome n=1 Tax=Thiocystis minor TaxID=61597 RepID=UPI003B8383B1
MVAGFPQYRARDGSVTMLEQRINSCFERSLNGQPLPLDHPAMVDIVAYMTGLSQGVPVGRRHLCHQAGTTRFPRQGEGLARGQ